MKTKYKKRKILCPNCKTGQESYIIDPHSSECPYFTCYNGFRCVYYTPINNKKKNGFFLKLTNIIKKIK